MESLETTSGGIQFMWSQRGQKLILYQGNKYRKRRRNKNGSFAWHCVKHLCPAKVYVDASETHFLSIIGEHDHLTDSRLARQLVGNCIKRAALETNLKPAQLVDKEISEKFPDLIDVISPRDIQNIKKSIMRLRHKAKLQQSSVTAANSSDSETSSKFHMEDDEPLADPLTDPLSLESEPSGDTAIQIKQESEVSEEEVQENSTPTLIPESVVHMNFQPAMPPMWENRYFPQGSSPSSTSPVPIAPKKQQPQSSSGGVVVTPQSSVQQQQQHSAGSTLPVSGGGGIATVQSHHLLGSGGSTTGGGQQQAACPPPPASPEVCLRWNSYHSNMQATFPSLLNNEQFVDVTLACEGRSIKCHKVMLSACSSYFEELLSQNPCQHPIILMRDMKFWEVQALVEFMYSGEVNVAQEKLPSLLSAAEALQIKGLTPTSGSSGSSSHLEDEPTGSGILGALESDDNFPPQPQHQQLQHHHQRRVRKRKSAHPLAYPLRTLQPSGALSSSSSSQQHLPQVPPLQKVKLPPLMSPLSGSSGCRLTAEEQPSPYSHHPPVRIKRERSSTPPLSLSMKEEPLDLGIDHSERNKDKEESSSGPQNSSLQDAISRLHGKHHLQPTSLLQSGGGGGVTGLRVESNGGGSSGGSEEEVTSGGERSPPTVQPLLQPAQPAEPAGDGSPGETAA